MDKIIIHGGRPLTGSLPISGAKNAALPLMAASLLTDALVLENVPCVIDIASMGNLLAELGAEVIEVAPRTALRQDADAVGGRTEGCDRALRSGAQDARSVLVLGPLLARTGHARVSLPGGCAIGTRPIDLHLKALAQLGAEIELAQGYVDARAPRGLVGADITFPAVTVTGTENVLMAAVLARGETILRNAAREPEVADLAECLISMGAKIDGIGTDTLRVEGVEKLHGAAPGVARPDRDRHLRGSGGDHRGALELRGTGLSLIKSVADALWPAAPDRGDRRAAFA